MSQMSTGVLLKYGFLNPRKTCVTEVSMTQDSKKLIMVIRKSCNKSNNLNPKFLLCGLLLRYPESVPNIYLGPPLISMVLGSPE